MRDVKKVGSSQSAVYSRQSAGRISGQLTVNSEHWKMKFWSG